MSKIKELGCHISDGNYSSKYPTQKEFVDSGIPFIRANNMKNYTIVDKDMYHITAEKHSELKKGHLKTGDVLIVTRGSIGLTAIVPEEYDDANINAQIVLIRCDEEKIHNRFLLWNLNSKSVKKQIIKLETGSTLKQLPVSSVNEIQIKDYSIEKQHRIADELDTINKLIDNRKEAIQLCDELITSTFKNTINELDFNSTLGECCKFQQGSQYSVEEQHDASSDGLVRFLRIVNYTQKSSDWRFVKPKGKDYVCNKDDVVVVRYGATAGFIGRGYEGILANNLFVVIPNKEILNGYLYYYLKSDIAQIQILSGMHSSSMPALNHKDMKKVKMVIPSIDEQKKIIEKCNILEEYKNKLESDIDNLQDLLNSKMNEYFS